MTPTTDLPVRSAARASALAVVVLATLALTPACADTRRSLGAECLKSQDCASGICAQFQCTAPSPTIDVEENADAAPAEASSPGSGMDAGSTDRGEASLEDAADGSGIAEGGDETVDASSDD
jgi:hypothetical protein